MTTAHPVLPHCACEICVASIASRSERAAYKALVDRFGGDLAKADKLAALASFDLMKEAAAFLESKNAKPQRWDIVDAKTGEPVLSLTLSLPEAKAGPEVVAAPDHSGRVASAFGAATMKQVAPAPAPRVDAGPVIAKAAAAVELVRGIQTKVAKADAERRRNHADIGRWSRETTVSDRLRSSDELRFTDLGEAVRHDHRREQLLEKAAKALKIDDVDHLRTAGELRLGKAEAAAHNARREDLLTTFGRDNAR